jgi:hypothetical protein
MPVRGRRPGRGPPGVRRAECPAIGRLGGSGSPSGLGAASEAAGSVPSPGRGSERVTSPSNESPSLPGCRGTAAVLSQ